MTTSQIYKILPKSLYDTAIAKGAFDGSPLDLRDGYIHLSAPAQLRETAKRHFADQEDLMLIAIDPKSLGEALRWEPSRGGQLFPHYYGAIQTAHFLWVKPLPWNGTLHEFPIEVLS